MFNVRLMHTKLLVMCAILTLFIFL